MHLDSTWNRVDGRVAMPRGDKSKYTGQQERKADHIAKSYESRGIHGAQPWRFGETDPQPTQEIILRHCSAFDEDDR
jgi:hypothetical protein